MSSNVALFACCKCFTKHPFEELSSGLQYCKDCLESYPNATCTYCRTKFQNTHNTSATLCNKCTNRVKQYGKPTACKYCNLTASYIGNICLRCNDFEQKYGPPVACEQCKQKCAFDSKRDDKKVDGKLLCWLCTSSKRVLAKTTSSSISSRDRKRHRTPNRVDESKVDLDNHESNDSSSLPPPSKLATLMDPNFSAHVSAMIQLKEQMASMQKELDQKEAQLKSKEKLITELKANNFTSENEFKNKVTKIEKEYEKQIQVLLMKIKTLQKELATLAKSNKKRS